MSFACAFAFVWTLWFTLPPTDGASGLRFSQFIFNPFVLPTMIITGLVAGLVVSPIVHFGISGRHYLRSTTIVCTTAIGWIFILTPVSPRFALFGVAPAILAAVGFCRFLPYTNIHGPSNYVA